VTRAGAPSRGLLAPQFLSSAAAPAQFLGALQASAGDYAGFNLLLADPESLVYFSNRVNEAPQALAPGIYGLSNHRLDEPWPKVVRTRARFAAAISRDRPDPGELFAILADRTVATAAEHADTDLPPDWQRAVSAPFVVHERYGTRCTTLVLVEHGQRTTLHERRFDAAGVQTGASRVEFDVESRGPARSAGPLRLPEETPELDTSTE
jgi:uncharacterized protein with NRDE domain